MICRASDSLPAIVEDPGAPEKEPPAAPVQAAPPATDGRVRLCPIECAAPPRHLPGMIRPPIANAVLVSLLVAVVAGAAVFFVT
jgi:hypothetical protein